MGLYVKGYKRFLPSHTREAGFESKGVQLRSPRKTQGNRWWQGRGGPSWDGVQGGWRPSPAGVPSWSLRKHSQAQAQKHLRGKGGRAVLPISGVGTLADGVRGCRAEAWMGICGAGAERGVIPRHAAAKLDQPVELQSRALGAVLGGWGDSLCALWEVKLGWTDCLPSARDLLQMGAPRCRGRENGSPSAPAVGESGACTRP